MDINVSSDAGVRFERSERVRAAAFGVFEHGDLVAAAFAAVLQRRRIHTRRGPQAALAPHEIRNCGGRAEWRVAPRDSLQRLRRALRARDARPILFRSEDGEITRRERAGEARDGGIVTRSE